MYCLMESHQVKEREIVKGKNQFLSTSNGNYKCSSKSYVNRRNCDVHIFDCALHFREEVIRAQLFSCTRQ
ncbi:hypothetical protein AV530_012834 [Patagioenas fasciata monilis]|uniref:Uncharacterized protein n=1 Tax=Patagioenas fasciata monilis TaxID=372326 RepID=A0A1V4J8X4_PATFA|nr:hypothetical protein AV530_012834 [Patagioenas fasciata monilis]